MRSLLESGTRPEPCLAPLEDAALVRHGQISAGWEARYVLAHRRGTLAPLRRAGRGGEDKGVRRPKKMLPVFGQASPESAAPQDRKSTRLNSSHANISYAVFCLKK